VNILHFPAERTAPVPIASIGEAPPDGLLWIDIERPAAEGWTKELAPLLGVDVDPRHISDSLNPDHQSFFDGVPDYDMLIFQGLGPTENAFRVESRTVTMFLFERIVVTVRAPDGVSLVAARQRLLEGRVRIRATPLTLAYVMLDTMLDRYLAFRDPFHRQITELQDALLDPANPFDDWRELLLGRRTARCLEALSEGQAEAIDCWRRASRFEWDDADQVRVRDLEEHIGRVSKHASNIERDIEAAVQLHFASVAHRTNRVIQILTIISVIFFPMSLITGIYGMNFDNMPEVHTRYGYFVVLGALPVLGGLLLWVLKRRGFF
jgi:Mg2+ and Co2+ transporter CorA